RGLPAPPADRNKRPRSRLWVRFRTRPESRGLFLRADSGRRRPIQKARAAGRRSVGTAVRSRPFDLESLPTWRHTSIGFNDTSAQEFMHRLRRMPFRSDHLTSPNAWHRRGADGMKVTLG